MNAGVELSPAGPIVADRRPGRIAGGDLTDLAARFAIGSLFLTLAIRLGIDFVETGRVTGLLLLMSELLVVVLTVVRRPATIVDRSLGVRLVTTMSILGPPLLRPSAGPALLSELITAPVSAVGLLVVIAGKMALGRSFGLIPAHRGLVRSGPYRLVRHPIYLGYLVTHVAFLAAHPTLWNFTALAIADLSLIVRSGCEERTLAADPEYDRYRRDVRWRLIPRVY